MGQVLHGSATTTQAVRRAIQLRQESVRALTKRYGVCGRRGALVSTPADPSAHAGTVRIPFAGGGLNIRPPWLL
jgi:hypothetical protein